MRTGSRDIAEAIVRKLSTNLSENTSKAETVLKAIVQKGKISSADLVTLRKVTSECSRLREAEGIYLSAIQATTNRKGE